MFYKSRLFIIICCVFWVGCGSSVTQDPAITPTPTPSSGSTAKTSMAGTIHMSAGTKRIYTAKAGLEGFMVVAQSNTTGEIYRGVTDVNGNFAIDLPSTESGNTFMVTILGPDGKAIGPVLFGTADGKGITGLKAEGEESLGTITIPGDSTQQAIQPGSDGNVSGKGDSNLTATLNAEGAPVGLGSHGKGSEAQTTSVNSNRQADKDSDGLIDMLDADDDGNGKVDDFDTGGSVGPGPKNCRINFFMNLKIQAEQATIFYSGSEAERNAALATHTVITLEVVNEPNATSQVKSVRGLETPGPAYLPTATILKEGQPQTLWSIANYAFTQETDRFDAFVVPQAVMSAGDTFTIEIEYLNGSKEQYSRMINYVFKNIPKLLKYGPSGGTPVNFDSNNSAVNGSFNAPIPFDKTKDLTLVFNPPPDETGAYLKDLDYDLQFFYYEAGGAGIQNIDMNATWPTKPVGMDNNRTCLIIPKASLTLAADNTYTFTIPKEFFPDTIQTSGGVKTVGCVKIDITAECPSGNCAIMLCFKKQ